VKPLIYQERKTPELMDDIGTQSSRFSKVGRFWIDMEGAAAFGRWQDAILMEFTAEPTLTELQTALGQIEDRFRTFQLPLALAGETAEYLHEQLVFSPETCTLLCSTNMSNKLRQILTQDTIVNSGAAITNIYKGFAKLVPTGLINTVS
jgi:phage major head subunit gpT-like protein